MREVIDKVLNVFVLRIAQIVFSLLIGIMIFFGTLNDTGLILSDSATIVLFVFVFLDFASFMLEFKKEKPLFRLIYWVLTLILIGSSFSSGQAEALAITWLFGMIYGLIALITIFVSKDKVGKEKTLPYGYFSKEHLNNTYILFFVLFIILVIFMMVWIDVLNQKLLVSIPIVFVFAFIYVIVVLIKTNPFIKVIKDMDNNCDYKEFSSRITSFLNENLHEETRKYILMIKSNYFSLVDKNQAMRDFKKIEEPKSKKYKEIFYILEINNYERSEEFDIANKLISEYKIKYPKNTSVDNFYRYEEIISTTNVIDNINNIISINTPNNFVNINNAYVLMMYYSKRNIIEEAMTYAQFILDQKTDFNYVIKEAKKALNK